MSQLGHLDDKVLTLREARKLDDGGPSCRPYCVPAIASCPTVKAITRLQTGQCLES